MPTKKSLALLLVISAILIAPGCRRQIPTPDGNMEPPYPVGGEETPAALLSALDSALAYVRQGYGSDAPAEGIEWKGERITAEGLVGGESYRFVSGDWEIIASYPVVLPDLTVYSFIFENTGSGFLWEGEVDAKGNVGEKAPDLVRNAFHAALEYLLMNRAEEAPEVGLPWISRDAIPKDIVGSGAYEFLTGDWIVIVTYPIVLPEATIYQITFQNQATGFRWHGEVDAAGEVKEIAVSP